MSNPLDNTDRMSYDGVMSIFFDDHLSLEYKWNQIYHLRENDEEKLRYYFTHSKISASSQLAIAECFGADEFPIDWLFEAANRYETTTDYLLRSFNSLPEFHADVINIADRISTKTINYIINYIGTDEAVSSLLERREPLTDEMYLDILFNKLDKYEKYYDDSRSPSPLTLRYASESVHKAYGDRVRNRMSINSARDILSSNKFDKELIEEAYRFMRDSRDSHSVSSSEYRRISLHFTSQLENFSKDILHDILQDSTKKLIDPNVVCSILKKPLLDEGEISDETLLALANISSRGTVAHNIMMSHHLNKNIFYETAALTERNYFNHLIVQIKPELLPLLIHQKAKVASIQYAMSYIYKGEDAKTLAYILETFTSMVKRLSASEQEDVEERIEEGIKDDETFSGLPLNYAIPLLSASWEEAADVLFR